METTLPMEQQDSETTIQYLTRLKDMGFLFHGSRNNEIEELEPRYAFDPTTPENTDTAVFATDNVIWSTIFGIYGGRHGWSTDVTDGKVIAKIPAHDKEFVDHASGTIYILPREKFKQSLGQQYKSHESVKPIGKVSVILQDYEALGGEIEWL